MLLLRRLQVLRLLLLHLLHVRLDAGDARGEGFLDGRDLRFQCLRLRRREALDRFFGCHGDARDAMWRVGGK